MTQDLSKAKRETLIRGLLERGLVSATELSRAELMAERNRLPVEQVLNQMGVVADEALAAAYATVADCQVWDSAQQAPNTSVDGRSVSVEFLKRHRMLPVDLTEVKPQTRSARAITRT